LNKRGKDWLAKGFAIQINRLATNVVRISPKIALKWKDELVVNQNPEIHMTLKSPPVLTNITNSKTPPKIYHQNIRGVRCKTNELISHLQQISPLILCLTEHHVHWEELQQIFMYEYKLAAYFCRMLYAKGGVCMYVHKSLEVESVDIGNYCKEKDL